jgi:hypothetical protein
MDTLMDANRMLMNAMAQIGVIGINSRGLAFIRVVISVHSP